MVKQRARLRAAARAIVLTLAAHAPLAAQTPAPTEPVPTFDTAYMNDPAVLKTGQSVWVKQCRHCHGASAYPGKAPKLNPGGMDAEFIFDRVTYGFRAMPPWIGVFTLDERKAVTAYIKSSGFSP